MVLSFLASLVVDLTVATVKYTYGIGYYLLYGREPTPEEKVELLLRQLNDQYHQLAIEMVELKASLDKKDVHTQSPSQVEPGQEETAQEESSLAVGGPFRDERTSLCPTSGLVRPSSEEPSGSGHQGH